MAELAFETRGLSVTLGKRKVLRELSFACRYGEVMAVLGPNGAGKSTLLRALAGLVPALGEVTLAGVPVRTLSAAERAKQVSFVPQHSLLAAPMPVAQVVAQGRYAHRAALATLRDDDRAAIAAALSATDIEELAQRPFSELSFGEQKRVLIARALATGARTLLLDEPTASLDIEHALRLFILLRQLASQGRAVVVVLHQLDHALAYCDRATLLGRGELVAAGVTREVITKARVRELYGVELVEGMGLGFRLPEGATP
jgi:iron complex transport system ATP-binding protein